MTKDNHHNHSSAGNGRQLHLPKAPKREPPLVRGVEKYLIGTLIRFHILFLVIRIVRYPARVFRVLQQLEELRRQYMGDFAPTKLMKIDGRYYWDMHAPGWPSKAFVKYNEGEINRIHPFRSEMDYLNSVILAITKKCPLNCEHCFEWDVINQKEKLSLTDLKNIVHKFQSRGQGVAQIQFSGGEPLSRYRDILEILANAQTGTDFWIVTSGYGFTLEKALALKEKGLTGLSISLDHFEPEKHDAFRGLSGSFNWVVKAVENAHRANLAVVLSLCATNTFTTEENMMQYAQLAKRLGAAFILVIEPRSVGRYAGKEVALSRHQEKILDDFFIRMNYDRRFADMPGVSYHGFHQRRVGCFGSGSRFLYVDTDGEMHVCPFCRKKFGHVLSSSIDEAVANMKGQGCQVFQFAEM